MIASPVAVIDAVPVPTARWGQQCRGRVLVVEDHALLAMGLQVALSSLSWDVATISGHRPYDVVAHAKSCHSECVLVDIHVGGRAGSGVELIGPLSSTGTPVVVLTAERRRIVLAEFIEAGAAGWIRKDALLDEVDTILDTAIAGEPVLARAERATLLEQLRIERAEKRRAMDTFERLTVREALVLGALIDGLTAEEIADAHFVALTTVRSQIRAVLQKLNVRSQVAAVALAIAHQELLPHDVGAGRDRRRADMRAHPSGVDPRR